MKWFGPFRNDLSNSSHGIYFPKYLGKYGKNYCLLTALSYSRIFNRILGDFSLLILETWLWNGPSSNYLFSWALSDYYLDNLRMIENEWKLQQIFKSCTPLCIPVITIYLLSWKIKEKEKLWASSSLTNLEVESILRTWFL